MDPIKKSILDANNKMDKSQIHDIILGGGSTRIPKVQKLLSDKMRGATTNTLRTCEADSSATSTATLRLFIARSVQNEHWIATN
uniref:Heat shock protein 70 n=1 Tax=Meloidogyne incognita TaxID=6306 RepID=A0A914NFB4_MELIC